MLIQIICYDEQNVTLTFEVSDHGYIELMCHRPLVKDSCMRFSQLVPWKHESVGQVPSGHQLGKPSDVRWIILTHEGSFVFIIHPS